MGVGVSYERDTPVPQGEQEGEAGEVLPAEAGGHDEVWTLNPCCVWTRLRVGNGRDSASSRTRVCVREARGCAGESVGVLGSLACVFRKDVGRVRIRSMAPRVLWGDATQVWGHSRGRAAEAGGHDEVQTLNPDLTQCIY